ncbi:MAG: hypothetical protein PHI97_20930 [Desulfobulbus sp.]|nr:hypothetical protein [Desulfobulbus sp.]
MRHSSIDAPVGGKPQTRPAAPPPFFARLLVLAGAIRSRSAYLA